MQSMDEFYNHNTQTEISRLNNQIRLLKEKSELEQQKIVIEFEQKLEQYEGDLARATVELAKDWRMDKMLRHLDAMLVVMDNRNSFIIAGDGNVIEPDGQIIAIGSGGGFAQAAAKALLSQKTLSAKNIASESLKIAAELCIYTNDSISVLEI